MLSIVAAAWRLVLKRARSDWLILSAAAVIVLLATTLLSAGPIYADAVAISGLRRALRDAPTTEANVQISVSSSGADYASRDDTVLRVASQTFAPIGGGILRSARSGSFALPGQPADDVKDLAVFGFFQQIEQHATLVSGAWPQSAPGVIEAAIPASTAAQLGLAPGSTLTLTSRLESSLTADVRISGTYQVNDVDDPYWWGETLDVDGVEVGETFTTFGPFIVTPDVFFSSGIARGARFTWRVYPAFDEITVSMLPSLIGNVDALDPRVNQGLGPNDRFSVETNLNRLLREAERSLLVTRSGVLIVIVQLAILAGYALLLTAGLLVEERRVETALLHARGSSTSQIVTMSLMEAVVLAIPAAVAGPWLAALSLRVLNHAGPLAEIGLPLHPVVTRDAYALAFVAALGCSVALAIPSLQSARSFVETRAARGRQRTRSAVQRVGIDLLLLAAAALAYWQLRRYGAPITRTVQGRIGIDPLLVAAPAIGLLAGAVVALRILPLLARLADRAASGGRDVVPALGAWQLARRPLGYARPALLLMLAVAIGLFAVSYGSTWRLSQQDQADYQVGADIRVRPSIRTGIAIPPENLAQAYADVEGVEATMPARRDFLQVSRSSGSGRVLAIDAAAAADVISFRADLMEQPFPALMDELAVSRPELPTVPLPGEPQRIALDVRLSLDPLPPDAPLVGARTSLGPSIAVTIRDARGLLYRSASMRVPEDGSVQRLIVPLAWALPDGRVALPQYPVSIAAITMVAQPLQGVERTGQFDLIGLETSARLDGDDWAPVPLDRSLLDWQVSESGVFDRHTSVEPAPAQPDGGLAIRFGAGSQRGRGFASATFRLQAAGEPVPNALPALVSEAFLAATSTRVGDTLPIELSGERRDVRIAGVFRGFPTLDPEQVTVVVDLPTLAALRFQSDGGTIEPGEWWIATAPARREAVTATLQAPPYSSVELVDRMDRGTSLRSDPVARGIIGALSLGYVAAAIFAGVGFAVSAAVSARSRLTEFALLRALGLSTRQLSGWLSLENGLLVVISLGGGTALGLALAWLILPLVSLTQQASRTVPEVIVVVPWESVLLLEAISLLVLLGMIGVLAAALRRIGLGSILRLGEE